MRNKSLLAVASSIGAIGGCLFTGDSCFVGATLVATPDGPRPIDTLRVGDRVWSWSFAEARLVARAILAVHRANVREARRFELDGGHVIRGVTPTHPIWSAAKNAYVEASTFVEGDTVAAFDGATRTVRRVVATEVPTPTIEVWNLSVDGEDQNYFADGVLVHNKSIVLPRCEPDAVRTELVTLDAGAGRYAVRVSVSDATAESMRGLYVYDENGKILCREPEATGPGTWTCTLTPLSPRKYTLLVSATPRAGGQTCELREELVVTVPGGDAGVADSGTDAADASDASDAAND